MKLKTRTAVLYLFVALLLVAAIGTAGVQAGIPFGAPLGGTTVIVE